MFKVIWYISFISAKFLEVDDPNIMFTLNYMIHILIGVVQPDIVLKRLLRGEVR